MGIIENEIVQSIHAKHGTHLLTTEQTAAELGVSPKTIRNYLSMGKFPLSPVRIGRSVRFPAFAIARFIVSGQEDKSDKRPRGRPTKAEQLARQVQGGRNA